MTRWARTGAAPPQRFCPSRRSSPLCPAPNADSRRGASRPPRWRSHGQAARSARRADRPPHERKAVRRGPRGRCGPRQAARGSRAGGGSGSALPLRNRPGGGGEGAGDCAVLPPPPLPLRLGPGPAASPRTWPGQAAAAAPSPPPCAARSPAAPTSAQRRAAMTSLRKGRGGGGRAGHMTCGRALGEGGRGGHKGGRLEGTGGQRDF